MLLTLEIYLNGLLNKHLQECSIPYLQIRTCSMLCTYRIHSTNRLHVYARKNYTIVKLSNIPYCLTPSMWYVTLRYFVHELHHVAHYSHVANVI